MGRAMLIICAGMGIAVSYFGFGSAQQGTQMTRRGAGYAKFIQAKNAAHTAIQIAMNEINGDPNFISNYNNASHPWKTTVDGAAVEVYIDRYYDSPTTEFWEPDSIRIVSTATYLESDSVRVVGVYLKNPYDSYVEPFKSPLTIATDNYTFTSDGSATISGVDASGQCDEDQSTQTPAVTLMGDNAAVDAELADVETAGTSTTSTDTSLSYQPTDDLIERQRNTDGVQFLSGNYKGDMGSPENPGVFFVDEPVKLSGGLEPGYGILVVTQNGSMEMDSTTVEGGDLSVSGNFEFNGLVIFEDAFSFTGRGTPSINGSVLVGNTEGSTETINIDLSGNITLQHDCMGEEYAKQAAAMAIQQNKYTRIVTYE